VRVIVGILIFLLSIFQGGRTVTKGGEGLTDTGKDEPWKRRSEGEERKEAASKKKFLRRRAQSCEWRNLELSSIFFPCQKDFILLPGAGLDGTTGSFDLSFPFPLENNSTSPSSFCPSLTQSKSHF
jgi:hypothetical protein